ncbi:MAG: hypothetical protein JWM11_1735 [Planctomycetaceae bacterium]|nr:hypothetical protein [Planctomycetaceae bacterium]
MSPTAGIREKAVPQPTWCATCAKTTQLSRTRLRLSGLVLAALSFSSDQAGVIGIEWMVSVLMHNPYRETNLPQHLSELCTVIELLTVSCFVTTISRVDLAKGHNSPGQRVSRGILSILNQAGPVRRLFEYLLDSTGSAWLGHIENEQIRPVAID